MSFNDELAKAKAYAVMQIELLKFKGLQKHQVKDLLKSEGYPQLDELVDFVYTPILEIVPDSRPISEAITEADFQRHFMELAVEQARLCQPEDSRIHPKVGAVVVKDGVVLAKAYRGETGKGEHAEFGALEQKLKEANLSGATVYATLEPCTTRKHPKIPCAQRLIERKIGRVVIGQLDPNPIIQGNGFQLLREANIDVRVFDGDLMAELEELNREFYRSHRSQPRMPNDSGFRQYMDGLSGDELYHLAMALKDRSQTIHCGRNSSTAAVLVSKGLIEPVPFQTDLKNVEKPYTIPTDVWRYLNDNKEWVMSHTAEKNQDRPERLSSLSP